MMHTRTHLEWKESTVFESVLSIARGCGSASVCVYIIYASIEICACGLLLAGLRGSLVPDVHNAVREVERDCVHERVNGRKG